MNSTTDAETGTKTVPNYRHDDLAHTLRRYLLNEQRLKAIDRERAEALQEKDDLSRLWERKLFEAIEGADRGIDYPGGDPIEVYFDTIHVRIRTYAGDVVPTIDIERLHVLDTAFDPFSDSEGEGHDG